MNEPPLHPSFDTCHRESRWQRARPRASAITTLKRGGFNLRRVEVAKRE
jgi:hypothetical protein